MSASSWDSYMDTLLEVIEEIKPKTVLEFGTGKSTGIICMSPSVKKVYSVEHDRDWYKRTMANDYTNLHIKLVPIQDEYINNFPKDITYDLIFVDGGNRSHCILESKKYLDFYGAMILHDASREEYKDAIDSFMFKIWTDGGDTVTLLKDNYVYTRLHYRLDKLQNSIGVKS
jgi:precorrin-6B methylase 2